MSKKVNEESLEEKLFYLKKEETSLLTLQQNLTNYVHFLQFEEIALKKQISVLQSEREFLGRERNPK